MRFSKLALSALALLALNAFPTHHKKGFALADDIDPDAVETEETATTDEYAPPENAENFEFEAEVHRMLDIVVNSLYQNKDVFLRELISNASDALDKVRFLGLTKPEYMADKAELEIQIEYDDESKTMTIRDSGIGMTKEDLIKNLGTVARSGTTKFMEALDEGMADMGMIGQFGVGFYSAFLVSDRVTVASKHPKDDTQHVWESRNSVNEFHVYDDPRGNTLGRGTEIKLHLKEDCVEYAGAERLKELATHYSEFITHPISLRTQKTVQVPVKKDEVDEEEKKDDTDSDEEKKDGEDDDLEIEDSDEDKEEEEEPEMEDVTTFEWDQLNTEQAIWTRDKDSITDDEYQNFWKVVSKDSSNASRWTHFNAEGNINFKSILYLPAESPRDFRFGSMEGSKGGLKLYVRKVLISDEFELLPPYLSFIKGVVDSDDLPLNVNRETLQESKIIQVIKKKLVRKIIEMMRNLSKEKAPEPEEAEAEVDADGNVIEKEKEDTEPKDPPYNEWYSKFSPSVKAGIIEDEPNRGKLVKLLRFETSKSDGKPIGLEEYVERMKDWQKEIYFMANPDVQEIKDSSFMERFNDKDVEVVFMVDPVDEYVTQQLRDFDGKKFQSITAENVELKSDDEDEDLVKRRQKAYTKMFKPLTKWLKDLYGSSVMKVMVSKRLGKSPAIMSSSTYGSSANMERIMRAQTFQTGGDMGFMNRAMKVFEINPRHPFILKLLDGMEPEKDEDDADIDDSEEEKEPFKVSDELVDAAWMLHDMALLNGGFALDDTKGHTRRMTRVLKTQMGVDSLKLADEIDPPEEEEEAPEIDPDAGLDGLNMADFGDLGGMGMGDLDDLDDLDA